jgi:hypothetical protein
MKQDRVKLPIECYYRKWSVDEKLVDEDVITFVMLY